jgi:hypothetical protein
MTTLEIKNKLIKKIQATENQDLLQEIYRLLDIDQDDFGVLNLSKEQREAISKGEQDIEKGDFLTDEQADKDIDQWLKK